MPRRRPDSLQSFCAPSLLTLGKKELLVREAYGCQNGWIFRKFPKGVCLYIVCQFLELDTPDYMVTFSGIICTLLTLQLSDEQVKYFSTLSDNWQKVKKKLTIDRNCKKLSNLLQKKTGQQLTKIKVDAVVPTLMDAFNLPDDIRSFMFDQYLPEVDSHSPPRKVFICWQIRLATADINLGLLEKGQFQLNTVGTLVKLIYAFLWQVTFKVHTSYLSFLLHVQRVITPKSKEKHPIFYSFWKSKNLFS